MLLLSLEVLKRMILRYETCWSFYSFFCCTHFLRHASIPSLKFVWTSIPRLVSLSVFMVVSWGLGTPGDGALSGLRLAVASPKTLDIVWTISNLVMGSCPHHWNTPETDSCNKTSTDIIGGNGRHLKLHPVRTAQLVARWTGTLLGWSGVQISPSPIEFSIGERLRERFYAVHHKIRLGRIEFELMIWYMRLYACCVL